MNNRRTNSYERPPLNMAKILPTLLFLGMIAALILVGLLTGGCTVTRVTAKDASGGETKVTSYTVAYPWLDTSKAVDKAQLTTGTNKTSVNLTGYSEDQTTSTNAAAMLERSVGAAVSAAVKAVK